MIRWDHEGLVTSPATTAASAGMGCEYPFHQDNNQTSIYPSPPPGVTGEPQNISTATRVNDVGGGAVEAPHNIPAGAPSSNRHPLAESGSGFPFRFSQRGLPPHSTHFVDPYSHNYSMYNSCGPPPSSVGYQRLCGGAPPPLQFRSGSSQMWHTTVMVPTQHWGAVGYFPAIVTRPSQLNFSGSYDPVAWSGPPSYPGQFAAGNRRQLGQQEQYRQPYSNYHNQPQPHRQMHAQPPYMAHRMTVNAVTYGFGDPTLGVYRTSADGWKYRGAYGGGRRPSPPFQAMVTRPLVSSNGRRRRGTHARANMAGGWGDLDTDDLYAFEAGENLDVDNMSYEELLELTERLGMVERGVQPARLNELRVVITPTHVKQQLESDRMVAGRNGLVKGGANIDQEEKEANEKMCEEDPIKCCICLDGVLVGQTATRMPCCRNFLHASCAAPWFESHFRCPICKSDIRGGDH